MDIDSKQTRHRLKLSMRTTLLKLRIKKAPMQLQNAKDTGASNNKA